MHYKTITSLIWLPSENDIGNELKWIKEQISRFGVSKLNQLSRNAARQRSRAYVPYSGYKVGASLLTISGRVYLGNNAERAGYSETNHAEEAAITNAIINAEIKRSGRKFIEILAVAHKGNTAPCGRCRQIMVEHCDNALVLVASPSGKIRGITSLKLLLGYSFTPSDLGIN